MQLVEPVHKTEIKDFRNENDDYHYETGSVESRLGQNENNQKDSREEPRPNAKGERHR